MVKMSKSFVVRMVIWSLLMLYLVCDFAILNGPLRKKVRELFPSPTEIRTTSVQKGICARVFNWPIYLSQVDRRVQEKLWRTGRSIENISAKEKDILRRGALDELIDEYLLRIKTNANLEKFEVSDAEIDAEMERFNKRFPTTEQRDEAITAQGMEGEKELRLRMTAILQQEKYLQHQTQKALSVSDAEAKEWYDAHQSEIALPERRRVRHLFIATLDTPSDEAREKLSAHLAAIKEGKTDIAKLASTVSEDEASKKSGGDLGWMRRARLPGDFAAPVFTVAKGTPTLIRTKLGWHIIEVTEIKPPAPLPFEQCKDEVKASISDQRRALVIKQYRHQLRIVNKERIEVYAEVFGVPDKKPDE